MKPDIDLDDHRTQDLIKLYAQRAHVAYQTATNFEDAIRPIYSILRPGERPRQIGSCVLVSICGEVFAFSASHVFDSMGEYAPLIGCSSRLHQMPGDRFSTSKGKSGTHRDDPVDASVFHFTGEIPSEIRNASLLLQQLNLESPCREANFHVALGFRAKNSKVVNGASKSEQEKYPSIEFEEKDYNLIGVDRKKHIALAYEDQFLVNGKWQMSPSPKGMSGGAILSVTGLPANPLSKASLKPRPQLAGIIIERRTEKNGTPGVLLGTRISYHLDLVKKYLPQLFEEEKSLTT